MKNYISSIYRVALFGVFLLAISASTNAETPKKKIILPAIDARSEEIVTISVYPNRAGKKFHLDRDYRMKVAVKPECEIQTGLISLDRDGNLKLRCGFSWNGANATIDTKTILRGSMVHDALYDLMRKGLLDSSQWRETADIELARICREDGMRKSRIVILNFLVRKFGERMTKVNPKLDSVSKVDHREIN